jgi:hypothetical protein
VSMRVDAVAVQAQVVPTSWKVVDAPARIAVRIVKAIVTSGCVTHTLQRDERPAGELLYICVAQFTARII